MKFHTSEYIAVTITVKTSNMVRNQYDIVT